MSALTARLAYRGRIVVRYAPVRSQAHHTAKAWPEVQAWLRWFGLSGASARTLDTYEKAAAKLLNANPTVAFEDFTDYHLLPLLESYPPKSRPGTRAAMNSMFKWGRLTRRIAANPVDLTPSMKYTPSRVIELFSAAEQAALCALPAPDGQLMTLLFGTGLRQSEARLLTGKRLDLDTRHVIIREGAKGSRDRVVPMLKPVAQASAEILLLEGISGEDFVWYTRPVGERSKTLRRSKPIGASSFHRWWVRCCDKAGVRHLKPHTTRHQYATNMRRMGLDVEEVQLFLGHASYETTMNQYVHTEVEIAGRHMWELEDAL